MQLLAGTLAFAGTSSVDVGCIFLVVCASSRLLRAHEDHAMCGLMHIRAGVLFAVVIAWRALPAGHATASLTGTLTDERGAAIQLLRSRCDMPRRGWSGRRFQRRRALSYAALDGRLPA